MKLMLAAVFLCIAIGLFSPRIGRRESILILLTMMAMAGLYYRYGERFM